MGSTWATNAPKAYHSDPEEKSFYQTAEWRRQRAGFLKKHKAGEIPGTKPGCCDICGLKPSREHVHHVLGVKVDPEGTKLSLVDPSCHEILEMLYRRTRNRYTPEMVLRLLEWATIKQEAMASHKAGKSLQKDAGKSSQPTEKVAA